MTCPYDTGYWVRAGRGLNCHYSVIIWIWIVTYFRIASVRLGFLLNLDLWPIVAELLEETVACGKGRWPVGADTLLVMFGVVTAEVIVPEELIVFWGRDGELSIGVTVDVSVDPLSTAYIPMFWSFSLSGPVEEMVEVPVVPELGEGCLKKNSIYYSQIHNNRN